MTTSERRWLLRIPVALVLCGFAALLISWYVTVLLPYDLRHGQAVLTDTLLAADITIVLLGVALLNLMRAALARRRAEHIRVALEGYQDALPRAYIAMLEASAAEDLGPVAVSFPHAKLRALAMIVFLLFAIGAAAFTLAFLAFTILPLAHVTPPEWLGSFVHSMAPKNGKQGTTPSLRFSPGTAVLGSLLFFGSTAMVWLSAIPPLLAWVIGAPARLLSNSEGITWKGAWGIRRTIKVARHARPRGLDQYDEPPQFWPAEASAEVHTIWPWCGPLVGALCQYRGHRQGQRVGRPCSGHTLCHRAHRPLAAYARQRAHVARREATGDTA